MSRAVRLGVQVAGAVRMTGGVALLVWPRALAARVAGPSGAIVPAPVCRLLGARLLGQGVTEVGRPRRTIAGVGAAVDLSHALSMAPAAAMWPRYRRSAAISAALALALVAVEAVLVCGLPDRGRR